MLLQLSLDPVQTSQLIAKEEVQSSFSVFQCGERKILLLVFSSSAVKL